MEILGYHVYIALLKLEVLGCRGVKKIFLD